MSTQSVLDAIQRSAAAEWMRTTSAGQMVEATHVVAAVLLFGTVLVVDLRLLGLADARRAFTRISRETLPLVWLAFIVSVITGSLMFAASPQTYFGNTAFRLKALALLGAGLNMTLFHSKTRRGAADWDQNRSARRVERVAGLLSVVLWAAVVLLGRWIGFTKGYDFAVPPGLDFEF
jgi:hypothetical protein